ncbi:MAG: FAD binding domain-containing protein [Spirochaetota bacterium]
MAADGINVYFPETLGELLQIHRREPEALVYAGGTFILGQRAGRYVALPPAVISLQEVEELRRVARTERYVELGATVPIRQILQLGEHNVPASLHEALRHIGPPAVTGLATVGGNLAIPGRLMTSVPVLTLLDSRVELRRQGGSRWLPVGRFHRADGSLDLQPFEIITRVRVPLYPWTTQVFRRFGSELAPDSSPLTFCGLARANNRILEELRIVGSTGLPPLLRNKSIEAELVGRRLPLAERDVNQAVEAYENPDEELSPIQRDRFQRLIHWFLLNLR